MLKTAKQTLLLSGWLIAAGTISAQTNWWIWSQSPDLTTNGLNVLAMYGATVPNPIGGSPILENSILGDDFKANLTTPITSVHFWGSWLNDINDPNAQFSIGIYGDNPVGTGGLPYSTPGKQLWSGVFSPTTVSATQLANSQRMWDPNTKQYLGTDTMLYDYTVNIPVNAAYMIQQGSIYWITIQAKTAQQNLLFGLTTRDTLEGNFGDAATYAKNSTLGSGRVVFRPLTYPNGEDPSLVGGPIDLAFALDTPEPSSMALLAVGLAGLLWRRRSTV